MDIKHLHKILGDKTLELWPDTAPQFVNVTVSVSYAFQKLSFSAMFLNAQSNVQPNLFTINANSVKELFQKTDKLIYDRLSNIVTFEID